VNDSIKMNIIIPTRERADTLKWTLKTCVEQQYNNLNIIVCDNYSSDNTREVVDYFSDERITYINPGRRLSMTQNWEFGLSHVSDGYVTILGDDDGLLPNAVEDVSKIIEIEKISAFSWLKADYCWPDHIAPEWRNYLSIPLENKFIEIPARKAARDTSLFLLAYSRTPTLYNSFVDYKLISALRKKTGAVLRSLAPDVYSGLALLSEMDRYLYSLRPFSVNGASSHSNGTSTRSTENKDAAKKYHSETRSEEIEHLGLVRNSIYSVIGESIFQANKYCYKGKLFVSKKLVLFYILVEMAKRGEHEFSNSLDEINQFVSRHRLYFFFRICMIFINPKKLEKRNKVDYGLIRSGVLGVNAEIFNSNNVYEATKLVYQVVNTPEEKKLVKYSLFKRLFSIALLKIAYFRSYSSF